MAVYEDIDEIELVDEELDRPSHRHAHGPRPHTTPILLGALVVIGVGVLVIDGMRDSPSGEPREATPVATVAEESAVAGDPLSAALDSSVAVAGDAAQLAAAPVNDTTPGADVDGCVLDVTSVQEGDSGDNVECVQKALTAVGYYNGPVDGVFSPALATSASAFQTATGLYVDGVVGRRTAAMLGIWPGDDSFVIRTPKPAAGAEDLLGFELSSVASAGADAPPLPPDAGQGTGKRIVYQRAGQRVWAIDEDENVVRSYLVSGSQFNNELAGRHEVYSKSETTTAWNGQADLPLMVRWLDTERGAIGFHQIPRHRSDGELYQTEDELGQKLSGGCQRQAPLDAQFMWYFADIGTPVYVL